MIICQQVASVANRSASVEPNDTRYTLHVVSSIVLQSVAPNTEPSVSKALSMCFGVKPETAASVVSAAPIILLNELDDDELASLLFTMRPLELSGAELSFGTPHNDNLPKIDWPQRPQVYRQDITEIVQTMRFTVPMPGNELMILDLLRAKLHGQEVEDGVSGYHPSVGLPSDSGALSNASSTSLQQAPLSEPTPLSDSALEPSERVSTEVRRRYTGSDLGEITPFSNRVLPSTSTRPRPLPA